MLKRIAGIAVLALALIFIGNGARGESNGPLSDKLSKRVVLIKDRTGRPIGGAVITVSYASDPSPPKFKTDASGRAEILIRSGFWELEIEYDGILVGLRGDGRKIEWPLELTLPLTVKKPGK